MEQYNVQKGPSWIGFDGVQVTGIEFYTGKDCMNAVYEQDEEDPLTRSTIKEEDLEESTIPDMMTQPQIRKRPTVDRNPGDVGGVNNPLRQQQNPRTMEVEAENGQDEDYEDFDTDIPSLEVDEEAALASVDQRLLRPSGKELMDIETPVAGETKNEEISRQERNFLRFFEDVEEDGGIMLDSQLTTLKWSENWRSFRLHFVESS
ncbi:hypothetical protein ABW19_dt0202587 [Dactylella cylindrospora]|nr:hypothetical protein ABW19_dt0202587 [Dactylella cylindrospora]